MTERVEPITRRRAVRAKFRKGKRPWEERRERKGGAVEGGKGVEREEKKEKKKKRKKEKEKGNEKEENKTKNKLEMKVC